MKTIAFLAAALALSGCSAAPRYMNDTQQTIAITTSPSDAVCFGTRGAERIFSTVGAGSVTVSKSKNPIVIECSAPGYATARQVIESSRDALSMSPLWDYASGALNKYPDAVTVALVAP